ncbi:hypothetical protein ABIA33_003759 [Streptacidiphilus sp. MAP12-16]|uniref:PKD domain-containing protein n=1 Tax=Streptacidiphilus sp. MAP12-16 TaxID=3156300 RepID=UPI0035168868
MRVTRISPVAALALFTGAALAATAPTSASAATPNTSTPPSTMYVAKSANCSDHSASSGSTAAPFCTIGAALVVVDPGQTISVAAGDYPETLNLTRSGTPTAPIVITGVADWQGSLPSLNPATRGAVVANGVHDVVLQNFQLNRASQDQWSQAVELTDSSDVTLQGDSLYDYALGAGGDATPGIVVSGGTGISLLRDTIRYFAAGVQVTGGATGTRLSNSFIYNSSADAVSVSGATGTVISNDTLLNGCGASVSASGGAAGTTVANTIAVPAQDGTWYCAKGVQPTGIAVAADSTSGSTADYNIVHAAAGDLPYQWGGANYSDLASFQAIGQGAHDIAADPLVEPRLGTPEVGSPAIDSADADVPGAMDPDLYGNPRVDDPLVPDTGTGAVTYVDRGAVELQDPVTVSALNLPQQAPVGHAITATATVANDTWQEPLTYTFDFGDGTPPVQSSSPSVQHTYAGPLSAPRVLTAQVTVTTPPGRSSRTTRVITVNPDWPLQPAMSIGSPDAPVNVNVDTSASRDGWQITSRQVDYGDGSPTDTFASVDGHAYQKPGTYVVTLDETDAAGKTATVTQKVTVGQQYVALAPTRVLDTRIGLGAPKRTLAAGTSMNLTLGRTDTDNVWNPASDYVPLGATSVVLNVTVVNPAHAGYLTVYPYGSAVPNASTVNYAAHQTVSNLVTVPLSADGKVSIAGNSSTDVVADVQGYYATRNYVLGYGTLVGTAPTRILDTRIGFGGYSYQGTELRLPLTGRVSMPADAVAAVLDVTVANPGSTGFVTAYPAGRARPTASNLNFAKGETTTSQVVVQLGTNGSIMLGDGWTRYPLVADLVGYYVPMQGAQAWSAMPMAQVRPLFTTAPTRILDTRTTTGVTKPAPIGPGGVLRVQVTGVDGLPQGLTYALVNLTAPNTTTSGYLTAYADGASRSGTSNLTLTPGQTTSNLVLIPVGADGAVDIFNHSNGTDVIADVEGYYVD